MAGSMLQVPHVRAGVWPAHLSDARLAAHVHLAMHTECQVALLGLPDDLGVRMNAGRPGAAHGPSAFRAALARYGVARPQGFSWPRIFDAGDVEPVRPATRAEEAHALSLTHDRVSAASEALVRAGLFPIAIGGGHDLTFAFVRGVLRGHAARAAQISRPPTVTDDGTGWGVLSFDAHLDVRETPGSGMPFRALVERCGVRRLLAVGINPLVNTAEHAAWFAQHGGDVADDDWAERLDEGDDDGRTLAGFPLLAPLEGCEHLACTFDMDVLDGSQAPGVSAVHPAGASVRDAARAIFRVACDSRLRCLDFMELSPPHDDPPWQDHKDALPGRTARVAAHLFLHALMGLRLGPLLRKGSEA